MTLADMPTDELHHKLRHQRAAKRPGAATTRGIGPCGHMARGADWCEACLRGEIERREAASR